ncbi:hypothetical protein ABFY54_29230 [Priestia megaterium]|uniref:hypothetical protein n=1 Tax=Priestia megaterium TaxID=1404 RepID=UPI003D289FE1
MKSAIRKSVPYVPIHKNVIKSTKFKKATDKLLYITLTSLDGQEVPDTFELAEMMCTTPFQVYESFNRLEKDGFIFKDENDQWVLMFY